MIEVFHTLSSLHVWQVRWRSAPSIWPRQATLRRSYLLESPSLGLHGATMPCGISQQRTTQTLALVAVLKDMGSSHTGTRQALTSATARRRAVRKAWQQAATDREYVGSTTQPPVASAA